MRLVVATHFYMIKMDYFLKFPPYARMDGCTPFWKPSKMPYHKIKFFRDKTFIFSMVLFCFLGSRFLIFDMVKIFFISLQSFSVSRSGGSFCFQHVYCKTLFCVGKITFLEFYQKSMGLLPAFFSVKNAKKRIVIKINYFYFIFIVFFYNKRKII